MHELWRHVTHAMELHSASSPYTLPDSLFVLNSADNMQRWGRMMPAPILSLQV